MTIFDRDPPQPVAECTSGAGRAQLGDGPGASKADKRRHWGDFCFEWPRGIQRTRLVQTVGAGVLEFGTDFDALPYAMTE